MIRAVTLDFWNTLMDDFLLPQREALRAARLRDVVAPFRYAPKDAAIAAAFDKSWENFDRVWYEEARTPTAAESAAVVLRALKIKLPSDARDAFVATLEEILLDCPPRPVTGVPETLPVLAERYALAVVCDAGLSPGRVLRRVLAHYDLERHFRAFFFSDEHGFSKPDPRAFLTPLDELDVAPHEAVHVGDMQRTDIAGAHGAGLRAIHFVGVNSSDMLGSSAEAVVHRFAELPAAVERLG
jgi:FMN phosphatase YigB (HAD superfamily)